MRVQGMEPLPIGAKEQLLSNDMPGLICTCLCMGSSMTVYIACMCVSSVNIVLTP